MLRSLFSGISGLRSHQTMLDVTGNNIANVNTTGFKASQTQFQDTLSQVLTNAGAPTADTGGTNPAQVGLGVKVSAISTNFQQGAAQTTNRSTDVMISGDGFFAVKSGAQTFYTRNGSFDFDAQGRLVTSEGAFVQGWAADAAGGIDTAGALSNLTLPMTTLVGAQPTTNIKFGGNLPSDAAVGTALVRDVEVFDSLGNAGTVSLTFTRTATGWGVSGSDGTNTVTGAEMQFDTSGALTAGGTITVGSRTVELGTVTGYAALTTVEAISKNGSQAGALQSFQINADGTIIGAFSNGTKQPVGRIAIATFANPVGLQKAGGSMYETSVNSGDPAVGVAGAGGRGGLIGGALEMSNVDLSQEFTNLIIAQRGFQANSRVITTSDELLQELVNLKR